VRTAQVAEAEPPGASDAPDRPDEELVRGVVVGTAAALAALYDRYGRRAYSLARRICGDDGLAEDVVQEAFLAFWRDPGRFDPGRGGFGTWILTLVHHKSVDAVRRESTIRRRTVPAAEEGQEWSAPPGPGADHGALRAVEAGQVRDALGDLPAEQREALTLAYFGGYSQREVATLTGVPLGTVKSRMFSGMRRLRGVLGPLLGEVSTDMGGGAR
jgi:RNA polymerase sigma factor (sigma-70 family)